MRGFFDWELYTIIKFITKLKTRLKIITIDFKITFFRLKIIFIIFITANNKRKTLIINFKFEPGKFIENFPLKTTKIKIVPINT